jgi:DNA (cytosine-5)-methyltransferase 1
MSRKMSIEAFDFVLKLRSQASKNNRLLLLDLYCGAGGASKGYMSAGFNVVGIDIAPQPRYCGNYFIQMSALDCDYDFLALFDLIHASPPCQAYSVASATARKKGKVYPDLVHPTRRLLVAAHKPYIMENVPPAPVHPDICLDGSMFGLGVIRKRIFETNIAGMPTYPKPSSIEGSVIEGDYVTVAGKGGGSGSRFKADWERAMGIDWMSKQELRESIPPAYTEWIGVNALRKLEAGVHNLKPMASANRRTIFVPKLYPAQQRLEGF